MDTSVELQAHAIAGILAETPYLRDFVESILCEMRPLKSVKVVLGALYGLVGLEAPPNLLPPYERNPGEKFNEVVKNAIVAVSDAIPRSNVSVPDAQCIHALVNLMKTDRETYKRERH